ncbi:MAG: ATP-binding protein [Desulfobulbaceae bacterium]|nr:ATP-binding protein [Desulfobulbaceae bacterium]
MIFHNFRIIFRIGLVIAVFCMLMVALAIGDYLFIRSINEKLEQLVYETYVKVELAQDMRFLARHKAVLVRNILLLEDQASKEFELERIKEEKKEYAEAQTRMAVLVETPEEKTILDHTIAGERETDLLWDKVVLYGMNGKAAEGMELLVSEVRSRQWGWLDGLNDMVDLQTEYARSNYEHAVATSSKILVFLVIINAFAIGIGLFFAIAVSRSIIGPLTDFSRKVEKIAQGDLSVRVDYEANDEIGMLGRNINRMAKMRKENLEKLEAYRLHLEELVEQRTAELSRQREEFVSVLIHDLKGPVTPILGFTRRLIEGKAKTPEDTLTWLQTIEKSSQQLLRTIERTSKDLRDKSALDVFNPERFDISELTRTVAESFAPRIEEKGLILKINSLEKNGWEQLYPIMFTGDLRQIRTVLENLLGNAVKYAKNIIRVELKKTDNGLQLSVCDDGPGIAKEYQKKIFEQYYQIPGSQKGTGIGLYSVLRVVENHRGSITVDSQPNEGSCFRVVLPAEEAESL